MNQPFSPVHLKHRCGEWKGWSVTILYYFAFFLFHPPRAGLITGALARKRGHPSHKTRRKQEPQRSTTRVTPTRAPAWGRSAADPRRAPSSVRRPPRLRPRRPLLLGARRRGGVPLAGLPWTPLDARARCSSWWWRVAAPRGPAVGALPRFPAVGRPPALRTSPVCRLVPPVVLLLFFFNPTPPPPPLLRLAVCIVATARCLGCLLARTASLPPARLYFARRCRASRGLVVHPAPSALRCLAAACAWPPPPSDGNRGGGRPHCGPGCRCWQRPRQRSGHWRWYPRAPLPQPSP